VGPRHGHGERYVDRRRLCGREKRKNEQKGGGAHYSASVHSVNIFQEVDDTCA